jgi:hypothetical protein
VGDLLATKSLGSYYDSWILTKVARKTATQVVTEDGKKFYKEGGNEVSSSRLKLYAVIPNEELLEEVKKNELINQITVLASKGNLKKLSYTQLATVKDILTA